VLKISLVDLREVAAEPGGIPAKHLASRRFSLHRSPWRAGIAERFSRYSIGQKVCFERRQHAVNNLFNR